MPHDAESAGALSTGSGSNRTDINGREQTAYTSSSSSSSNRHSRDNSHTMASRQSSGAGSRESDASAQYDSISTSQKMISATWGSLLTSLLGRSIPVYINVWVVWC